jgi:hypothetical protein
LFLGLLPPELPPVDAPIDGDAIEPHVLPVLVDPGDEEPARRLHVAAVDANVPPLVQRRRVNTGTDARALDVEHGGRRRLADYLNILNHDLPRVREMEHGLIGGTAPDIVTRWHAPAIDVAVAECVREDCVAHGAITTPAVAVVNRVRSCVGSMAGYRFPVGYRLTKSGEIPDTVLLVKRYDPDDT